MCLNSPCYETPKNAIKNQGKKTKSNKKNKEVSNYSFFWCCGRCTSLSSFFFHGAPCQDFPNSTAGLPWGSLGVCRWSAVLGWGVVSRFWRLRVANRFYTAPGFRAFEPLSLCEPWAHCSLGRYPGICPWTSSVLPGDIRRRNFIR
jgi:hypothetical protein